MIDLIKRYGTWGLAVGMLLGIALQPSLLNTILISTVAVLQTVLLAEAVQFIFTRIDWTNTKLDSRSADFNEIIIASKFRALGMIFIGVSIVVGMTYYAVYFLQRIPGGAQ